MTICQKVYFLKLVYYFLIKQIDMIEFMDEGSKGNKKTDGGTPV